MNDRSIGRYVGRLAPSPTGALHLGNVRTFMIAWLRARSLGGKLIMRIEDLDHPRDKPGAAKEAIEDLKWLGFDWDEFYIQSERKEFYRDALEKLRSKGLVYPCICSRRDVEAAQSAPHEGEQLFYSGTCRGRYTTWAQACRELQMRGQSSRLPCWRFKVDAPSIVEFDDVFAGRCVYDVSSSFGDFPIARDEGAAGYTLAVVVDDSAMGVTEIVRGDDLLSATPQQILLRRSLDLGDVSYLHVPLAVGKDGRRLAKRHGDTRIKSYREMGVKSQALIGLIASSCGWAQEGENITLADLLPRFDLSTIPHNPWVVDKLGNFVTPSTREAPLA